MSNKHRILVVAHGHPDFSLGGAEVAAYNLYLGYQQQPEVEKTWFMARIDRGGAPSGKISIRRENEYLWEQCVHDWDRMSAGNKESLESQLAPLIEELQPTAVHFHHYAHMGLEMFRVVKNVNPEIKIYLTLHEYMAICQHDGQMVKTDKNLTLCNQSSDDDCARCFPSKTREHFWLRKYRFLNYFNLVDHFFSPSHFLKDRYVAWGLEEQDITVIENGHQHKEPIPPRELKEGEARNRFAYFGQVTRYKGLDLLLKAMNQIPKKALKNIHVEIHGANLESQTEDVQEAIHELLDPLVKVGAVTWCGPYQPNDVHQLMANVDWILMPSIWWENSPMIIQEAFRVGRPVVCSDIGGMEEKVSHQVNGYNVRARGLFEWSRAIVDLSSVSDDYLTIVSNIESPINVSKCAGQHLRTIEGEYEANSSHWDA